MKEDKRVSVRVRERHQVYKIIGAPDWEQKI